MLHVVFYFLQVPVFDKYNMNVGYVSGTCTQFRHLNPLKFMIFEEKKLTLARKTTFLAHG